jgi:glycerol-3-phosphate dehydrogenase
VLLCEQGDLAGATSSASTKLIHGGLRYLEQYAFRLVRESLAEREVLLAAAPHLIRPMRFVLPHAPHLRPAWMLRTGLWLYDHLGGRRRLPASQALDLSSAPEGRGLAAGFRRGFVYSDCWVDDARLVLANALDAAERGALVRTRTKLVSARAEGGLWRAELEGEAGSEEVRARLIVNAAGAAVATLLRDRLGVLTAKPVRLVKGSHIVVRRLFEGEHAYLLQNADRRVVFAIPYEDDFTLIGTTDVDVASPEPPRISPAEADYLCAVANRFLRAAVAPADVVWSYSGVRPLYDDGSADPAAVTRDYVLDLDRSAGAPALSVYGGKITTYRRLAEHALERIGAALPVPRGPWTAGAPLPGGEMADFDSFLADLRSRHPGRDPRWLRALARRHGTRADELLGDGDLGRDFGGGLTEREARWCLEREWATTPDDVLWRRTKCGLHMSEAERRAFADWMAAAPVV